MAVPVLKLYYQTTKIQPAAGDGSSSAKVVLPESKNPAGRRRWPFQYCSCSTRARKSSRPAGDGRSSTAVVLPENENPVCRRTAVPVLKLYYQRRKIQPAAGDGCSSTKVVPPENENLAGSRFQYFCTLNKTQSQDVRNDAPLTKIQCTNPRPEMKTIPRIHTYIYIHISIG